MRAARERAGLTQSALARQAGMSVSVVNAIERGRRQPSVQTLASVLAGAGLELRLHLVAAGSSGPAVSCPDLERAHALRDVFDLAERIDRSKRAERDRPVPRAADAG